jgi:Ca2+-binding RTX toxin-like protein
MRHASIRPRVLRRRAPIVGAILAAVLLSAPVAFAGSDLNITVKNDLTTGVGNGYPKVALVTSGGSDCWYDEDLGRSKDQNAVAPGASKKIWTDVKQSGSPCAGNFRGVRGVALWIKETPSADWVALDGQTNAGGTDFQFRFGRKSDWNTADDCDDKAFGNNCFSVAGFPQTWSTRPSKVGLWCPVVQYFDQNDMNSRAQESNLTISVRGDSACNTPRGAVYWPRMRVNGDFVASVFPTMSGDVMAPRSTRQSDPPAPSPDAPGSGDASMVLSILSGTRLMCAWGMRDVPGQTSKIPTACQDAAKPSEYTVNDLTVPTTPPPKFKVLQVVSSGEPFVLVGKNEISVPPTGPASSPIGVTSTTQYGRSDSTTDSVSRTYGGKIGYKWGHKITAVFKVPFFAEANQEISQEVSTEFNASGTFGTTTGFTSSTTKSTAVAVSTSAQPGKTTVLRVYKSTFGTDYRFRADVLWGVDGKREPVASPAALATGMSASKSQSCLATVVGDETVTGSIMEFGKRFVDRGGDRTKLSAAEAGFLDSIPNFYIGSRDCPGFPAGFASQAGFKGEGVGSMASDAQDSIPVLNPDGSQAFDENGKPKGVLIEAMSLTSCVFTAPYPATRSTANVRLAAATPRADVNVCGPVDSDGTTSATGGTYIDLADGPAARGSNAGATYDSPATALAENVVGTTGDDVITFGGGVIDIAEPSAGSDRIHGEGGYDLLYGGTGDDLIHGGTGQFMLSGGPGADRIIQGKGNGQINGGNGTDRITVTNAAGTVHGDAGRDHLEGRGNLSDIVFAGGEGNDTYVFGPGGGCAEVFETAGDPLDTVRTGRCVTGIQDVERVILEGNQPLAMTTGFGTQTIIGNSAGNRLSGGPGADRIDGGPGTDLLILGSDAFDIVTGGADADRFRPTGTPAAARGNLLPADAVAHRITDFDAAEGDVIVLSADVFGSTVRDLRTRFTLVGGTQPQATSPIGTLLWNTTTRLLSFDRDGSGPVTPKVIALLPSVTTPSSGMFVIS